MRWTAAIAGLFGIGGLIGATLYAHALPVPALQQGAYIALFHTAPLLWLSRGQPSLGATLQATFFTLGGLLFSGSIYLRYLAGWVQATAIAPAGGTLLMLGWALLLVGSLRKS